MDETTQFGPSPDRIDPAAMADLEAMPQDDSALLGPIPIPGQNVNAFFAKAAESLIEKGHVKSGSGFIGEWRDSRDAQDAETRLQEWAVNTDAILEATGERVHIIGTDLFSSRRVEYIDFPELPLHWVDVKELAATPASTIAQREIDIAAKKDALIAGLREETATLSEQHDALEKQIHDLTVDYDAKLKAQLTISNGLMDELKGKADYIRYLEGELARYDTMADRVVLQMQPASAQRGKIETTTHPDIDDGSLTDFINQGWRVAFEAAYVLPAYDKEVCHMVRLERDAQDEAHSPMEAHVSADLPSYEDIAAEVIGDGTLDETPTSPEVEEIYIHMDDGEPAWKSEMDPVKREAMIYAARKATVGQKAAGRMIAQARARQKRQRDDGLIRVGDRLIDPQAMPMAATLASGITADELIAAMNEKVKAKVMDAMRASQPQGAAVVPLLLGQ
jgi:hypothetical protein